MIIYLLGPLDPVSNLSAVPINSTTVQISWNPPYSLEGVPILYYVIEIMNTTSRITTFASNTTTNSYSIDHPDPENNFTVTVVPMNKVGAGQPSSVVFTFPAIHG